MAFSDYSSAPGSNSTIGGINIAEGCPAGNINGAIRQLMADARAEHDNLPNVSALAPKAAAVFEGTQPKYTGRGAMLHHNNPANASGRLFFQASGGPVPSGMVDGDLLGEW
jgi:hypothetical protein